MGPVHRRNLSRVPEPLSTSCSTSQWSSSSRTSISITFNPVEVSDNMKKYAASSQGSAGKPTEQYLAYVLSRLTFPGSIYLAIVVIPCTPSDHWRGSELHLRRYVVADHGGVGLDTGEADRSSTLQRIRRVSCDNAHCSHNCPWSGRVVRRRSNRQESLQVPHISTEIFRESRCWDPAKRRPLWRLGSTSPTG